MEELCCYGIFLVFMKGRSGLGQYRPADTLNREAGYGYVRKSRVAGSEPGNVSC